MSETRRREISAAATSTHVRKSTKTPRERPHEVRPRALTRQPPIKTSKQRSQG